MDSYQWPVHLTPDTAIWMVWEEAEVPSGNPHEHGENFQNPNSELNLGIEPVIKSYKF